MQKDNQHLNFDLDFLDNVEVTNAKTHAASRYKVNWRNITIIAGLIIAFFIWFETNDKPSSQQPASSSSISSPTYGRQESPYPPSEIDNTATVDNGQFYCSQPDLPQAKLLSPSNTAQLEQEEQELERRNHALDSLRLQIEASGVTPYSDQTDIDRYNAMVAQYNAKLVAVRAAYSSHQTNKDVYNQQVEDYNNFLLTHCRKGR
jgi:hypothetical protein